MDADLRKEETNGGCFGWWLMVMAKECVGCGVGRCVERDNAKKG